MTKKQKSFASSIPNRQPRVQSENVRTPSSLNDIGVIKPVNAGRERAQSKDHENKKKGYDSPDTEELVKEIQDDDISIASDDRDFIDNISWDTNSNENESDDGENELGTIDT